jgi:DNA topoisomerase-1
MVLNEYLVIVESPSKCKTIEGYLGDKYKVIATCGHFRSLDNLSQITMDDDIKIKYSVSKTKVLKQLKEEILMSKHIILATDNDREGEAIAWHICDACKLPFDTPRIIFHEITKDAIQKAILSPTIIDMTKVNSQKSRQVLDLYIGFTISPILWKYIQHKLSAGRCQTPALKMLYEREKMIQTQSYDTKYIVKGIFSNIEFKLVGNIKKDEVIPFLEVCRNKNEKENFIIEKKETNQVSYSPPTILITSTLQQRASQVLGMSPKQTMMCAQTLYEHGLITYMRTETSAYSISFIEKIHKVICLQYGKDYVGEPCSIVDTHEGIRVTELKIEKVEFDQNVNRLYEFIYKHTFQSCMATSVYIQTPYEININDNHDHIMRYVSSYPKFDGWKILNKEKECNDSILQFIKNTKYTSISAKEQCEDLLLHYTEAQLINRLEKENIGRPSTYTSILDSLEKYIIKGRIETKNLSLTHYILTNEIVIENENKCIEEKNKLKITDLGEKVVLFCYKYFNGLFDYSYTKEMELFLDSMTDWTKLKEQIIKIKDCSSIIINEIKPEYKSLHCGQYKNHPLIIKDGPHGYYLDYKKEKISLKSLKSMESIEISEWIKDQEMNKERMKILIDYINNNKNMKINNDISIRKNKDKDEYYLFYKTSKMKKPKFYSFPNEYMNEDNYDKIKEYIEKKYKLI